MAIEPDVIVPDNIVQPSSFEQPVLLEIEDEVFILKFLHQTKR